MNAERVNSTKMVLDIKAPTSNLKTDVVSRKFSEKLSSFSESKGRELTPRKDIKNLLRNDIKRDAGLNKTNEVNTDQNTNSENKLDSSNKKDNKQVVENSKDKSTEVNKELEKSVENQESKAVEEITNDIVDESLQAVVSMANITEKQEINVETGPDLVKDVKVELVKEGLATKELDLETETISKQPILLDEEVELEKEVKLQEEQPVVVNQTVDENTKDVVAKFREGSVDNTEKTLPRELVREISSSNVQKNDDVKAENKEQVQTVDTTKIVVNSQNTDENSSTSRESFTPNKESTPVIKEDTKNPIQFNLHERGDIRTFEEVVVEKFDTEKQTVDKMLRDISYELDSSKKQMKIKLQPRELGDMTLDMRMVKGELVAKIVVDNEKARVMVEQNLINLKETLRKQNIEIKTVEVQVGNNENYEMHGQNMNQEQTSRGQKQLFRPKNNNFGYSMESIDEVSQETGEIISEGFDVSV